MLKKIRDALKKIFTIEEWEVVDTVEVDAFGSLTFFDIRRRTEHPYRWRCVRKIPDGNMNFCACEVWVLEKAKEE